MGDEENAEMNAQQKAKPDVQSGGSSKSSLIDTYAPVPDFFYDVKREIEPIGSSSTRVRHLATVLYITTILVLFGSLLYNYMPAQRISQLSIVTSEWQKDGFICKPLQKTNIEGLSTDWSYDECLTGVSRPNVDTVIPVEKSDNSSQFDYRFATQGDTSGSLSFWDTWNGDAVTSDEWQKDEFVCKPLQRATIHGLSTDWSYDECVSSVSVADTSTVTAVRKHHDDHFDYTFFSGGVISFYDEAYDSSILQKTNAATDDWKRDGYACYPEPPYDNTYNLNYNFSECFPAVLPPSSETVSLDTFYDISVVGQVDRAKYNPFGTANGIGYPAVATDVLLTTSERLQASGIYTYTCGESDMRKLHDNDLHFRLRDLDYGMDIFVYKVECTFNVGSGYPYTIKSITVSDGVEGWKQFIDTPADEYGNYGSDVICSKFKRNGNGFRCINKPKPPATKELAIERYNSEYPAATICDPLKQNSPFKCTPTDTPPTTKDLAIERYTAAYTPESICAPLKLNSPFQCTRNVEVPTTTILSLSVASAQAVFAAGGLVFVSLLRKLEKPGKNTATSVDDDLRVLVRKLRVGQDELRDGQEKLRVGQDEVRGGQSRHEELIEILLKKGGDHQV